jgi:hypothetical protein
MLCPLSSSFWSTDDCETASAKATAGPELCPDTRAGPCLSLRQVVSRPEAGVSRKVRGGTVAALKFAGAAPACS